MFIGNPETISKMIIGLIEQIIGFYFDFVIETIRVCLLL